MGTTLNEYQIDARVTLGDYYKTQEGLQNYLTLGLAGEVGEVTSALAKHYRG